jgi:superfamily II helicase
MGILDNLEAALEKAEQAELCYYCKNKAKYEDIAEIEHTRYDVVGVCECHSYKGLVS